MMKSAMERGTWVFFQNCHLAPSWMPTLERLVENIDPSKVARDFRLWLTSMPSPKFPVSILQNGSKMTVEPPRGLKANLMEAYHAFNDTYLDACSKPEQFKKLLLCLCTFHGVVLERRKYGSLGFNIRYPYNKSDLAICQTQLQLFLEDYDEAPFKVLVYTAGHINYGGRVTDDWDRRCQMTVLESFYNPGVLDEGHKFSPSGIFYQPAVTNHEGYLSYLKTLPLNDMPEIFGLHENANITFANNETSDLLGCIIATGGGGKSAVAGNRDKIIEDLASEILHKIPSPIDIEAVARKYPVLYEESMNTVLIQEVIRFNNLLNAIQSSLRDLLKALKGLVVMSEALERMAGSMFLNQVPAQWTAKAYPSLKPLASWVTDLLARVDFIHKWIEHGVPPAFWISGFFFPQAFLTGALQNFARKYSVSIDTISFEFEVMTRSAQSIKARCVSCCSPHSLLISL